LNPEGLESVSGDSFDRLLAKPVRGKAGRFLRELRKELGR